MSDQQKQAQCLRILAHALIEMAEVMDSGPGVRTQPVVNRSKSSVRNNPTRKDGSAKMWAQPIEVKRVAMATVLGAFVSNGGIITKEEFKDVARSVGYDTRGLASFSTAKTDLVQKDPSDPTKRRLTAKGYEKYGQIRQYDRGPGRAA